MYFFLQNLKPSKFINEISVIKNIVNLSRKFLQTCSQLKLNKLRLSLSKGHFQFLGSEESKATYIFIFDNYEIIVNVEMTILEILFFILSSGHVIYFKCV